MENKIQQCLADIKKLTGSLFKLEDIELLQTIATVLEQMIDDRNSLFAG